MSRTRFAPAPTGYLHLGHVVNAIYVWGMARARGARVLLRVEDHDAQRCRPEYERALLDDLDWLGFEPDEFPTQAFRSGVCTSRQSDRRRIHADAAAGLISRGLVYACKCSRQTVRREARSAELPYPGTCRDRGLPLEGGGAWRLRFEAGTEIFDDLLCGPQRQDPSAQCGDLVIRDRLGNWTYQFAAAADDFLQDIDLVIRGRDLLASTGRQIRTAQLLGRPVPPSFAHHPLVMKSPTQKLSKSDADTGVRDLRRLGWTPARLIGTAAHLAGLAGPGRDIAAREVAALFEPTSTRE